MIQGEFGLQSLIRPFYELTNPKNFLKQDFPSGAENERLWPICLKQSFFIKITHHKILLY